MYEGEWKLLGRAALAVAKRLLWAGVPAQSHLWHGEGILWEPQQAWAGTTPTAVTGLGGCCTESVLA